MVHAAQLDISTAEDTELMELARQQSRRGFPKWYGIRRQRDAWYIAELPGCGIESDGATR